MKLAVACALALFNTGAYADDAVRGYMRPDGRYVAPYVRTPRNGVEIDNYSGPGAIDRFPRPPAMVVPRPITADDITGGQLQIRPSQPGYAPAYPVSPFLLPMPDTDDDDDD